MVGKCKHDLYTFLNYSYFHVELEPIIILSYTDFINNVLRISQEKSYSKTRKDSFQETGTSSLFELSEYPAYEASIRSRLEWLHPNEPAATWPEIHETEK